MHEDSKNRQKDNHSIILYENIFRQYYEPLIKFANRYVSSATVAENIIHDVFLYLWDERDRLDFNVNIKSYLYNAVKNRCINYLNKKKLENQYKVSEFRIDMDRQTPESILINKELNKVIKSVLNKMPPKQREIYIMSRFDQLTYTEIASILNISVKTVETQMSRSLKYLKKKLSAFILSVL
jgi:RNA polymerase sigma-70 factor (ECF subfamily)